MNPCSLVRALGILLSHPAKGLGREEKCNTKVVQALDFQFADAVLQDALRVEMNDNVGQANQVSAWWY